MTKTNLTKTAMTIALITALCFTVSGQGLSEKEAREARNDLARSYRELVLKLFPGNTDLKVVVSKGSAARALGYKLVAEDWLFSDSMGPLYQKELSKIAEWIESKRDDLERVRISEVGLSSGKGAAYLGKSSFVRNKDGEWEFTTGP